MFTTTLPYRVGIVKNEMRTALNFLPGLSVVIPALNAAQTLPGVLAALGSAPAEIVLVDGGSTDATRAIAAAAGSVRVLAASRGRGGQIAAGTRVAAGPWLLLLHADTILAEGWVEAVRACMASPDGPARAWYFRLALDDHAAAARRLERAVAWRCRVLGLPYGDQALLIHADLLDVVGGVRELPLMEDVDLVSRLGRHRLGALDVPALTSAARWRREGYLARSARNLLCLGLWFAGVPPRILTRIYRGRSQG